MLTKINLNKIKSLQFAKLFVTFFVDNKSNRFDTLAPLCSTLVTKNLSAFSITKKPPLSQTKITFQIQKAASAQELHSLLNSYEGSLNYIHRTVLLQKVTQRPFDQDEQLVSSVINSIKSSWRQDYSEVTEKNARAIANSICYMSRKKKLHQLDSQFIQIDFDQLAKYLNPKQFVMTINGILKLQLTDEIIKINKNKFSLQNFITQNVDEKFTPSLLVSIWFNLIKYQKTTKNINDFFANRIKNKHFKNNLIDYTQMIFCYVNSESNRSVDLTYPVMTHPKQINPKVYFGAHQLSVLYEQLAKLKKIKDVYFSDQFAQLLQSCYLRILNEKDVPLRNVANVFNYLVQYENPTSQILDATFYKYFAVIKNQISLLQRMGQNKKPRMNIDSLSFVTLFTQLLQFYQPSNKYLNEMTSISFNYIDKIISNSSIINEYNERTFMRLLSGIQLNKKMIEQQNPGRILTLNNMTKFGFEKEIIRRDFTEVQHLGKLINFIFNHEIRSKQVCMKISKLIELIPQENQLYSSFQQRLKQKCILNKNCKNCSNCFSN